MRTAKAGREHLHVMLPRQVKLQVDRLVADQRRTKYDVVTEALRDYFAKQERPIDRPSHLPKSRKPAAR